MMAVQNGCADVVKELLKAGADVEFQDKVNN